ncbi:MAG: hypothetical protein RIT45_2680 [Pseudomonadota bacterium]|jgi:hypothetical protein
MRRLLSSTSGRGFALWVLLATVATPSLSLAAAPQPGSPFRTLHLPALPGSSFAERISHHHAEADGRGAYGLPDTSGLVGMGATMAAFGALLEQGWRIEHQEAEVETDAALPGLAVAVTVTVEALEPTGLVQFRFPLIDVDSVQLPGGATATWEYGESFGQLGIVAVTFDPPIPPGDKRDIEIRYSATLDCNAKTTLLRTCTFDEQFQQVLFFRYFADHAKALHAPYTSTLHVITPAGRTAAAPGDPMGYEVLADGRLRWTFEQAERTENGGFSIADYAVTGTEPDDVPGGKGWLRLVTLTDYAGGAKALHSSAKAILDYYGARFGAFPWNGLSLIQVANNFGGGYAPLSGIFMLRNVFGAKPQAQGWSSWNELTAHEIAHQWWGNLARPMSTGDVSLSESLAEFSSCIFTEQTLETRSQLIQDNLSYVYTVDPKDDRPLGSASVYSTPSYVPIVYHKGAVVLDMLRHEIGEKAMLDGLKIYAAAFDRDYARVGDLRKAMEESAGRDLGWFFDQWWGGKGRIDAEFSSNVVAKAGGGFEVRLRVAQLGAQAMRFKLPLRLTFHDGEVVSQSVDVVPPSDGTVSIISFDVAKRPLIVRPDISRQLLRRFRVVDGADVSLDGIVDGVDLMETAFRFRRTIVWKNSFFPNSLWDELFDSDGSFSIDAGDLDLIFGQAGQVSFAF